MARAQRPAVEEIFFNTSGLLYKSMELKDKLPGMSEEEIFAASCCGRDAGHTPRFWSGTILSSSDLKRPVGACAESAVKTRTPAQPFAVTYSTLKGKTDTISFRKRSI